MIELATGRFVAQAENVLLFGPPGVGKTHLSVGLGRAVVEAGHSVLFVTATALLATLARAETEGKLGEQLTFFTKPKLLVIDELGYLPFEKRSAHLFFQLVVRRYERGSMLITTNQSVAQWGRVAVEVATDEEAAAREQHERRQRHGDDDPEARVVVLRAVGGAVRDGALP